MFKAHNSLLREKNVLTHIEQLRTGKRKKEVSVLLLVKALWWHSRHVTHAAPGECSFTKKCLLDSSLLLLDLYQFVVLLTCQVLSF